MDSEAIQSDHMAETIVVRVTFTLTLPMPVAGDSRARDLVMGDLESIATHNRGQIKYTVSTPGYIGTPVDYGEVGPSYANPLPDNVVELPEVDPQEYPDAL